MHNFEWKIAETKRPHPDSPLLGGLRLEILLDGVFELLFIEKDHLR